MNNILFCSLSFFSKKVSSSVWEMLERMARFTSCSVVYSLRVSGFEGFRWVCWFLLWASFGYTVYTSCVLRGTLCFFNKCFHYLYIKKKKITVKNGRVNILCIR
jgi:hypothetical protein